MNTAAQYVKNYRSAKVETPLEVRRALDISDRSRTSVLPWKGQFSPQLIEYLLERHPGHRILDPFCGSGTVLYEAAAYKREAIGIDINPAAVALASLANYCSTPMKSRLMFVDEARETILKELATYDKTLIELDFCQALPKSTLFTCFLLILFGDKKEVPASKVGRTFEQIATKLMSLPQVESQIEAMGGDARFTPFKDGSFDLVVTSPPYINVFNYHQNYRPVMEALGYTPLAIAKAEIGANRKHRQNRFLTVIQYCMDMQSVFEELWRLVSPGGESIFVVGHSSKVRGVSFYNAELIAAVAELSGTFSLIKTEERAFVNRYGDTIGEDVLVLSRVDNWHRVENHENVGRNVGSQALSEAVESCDDVTIKEEILDAFSRRGAVCGSPRVR